MNSHFAIAGRLGWKLEADWKPKAPDYMSAELVADGLTRELDSVIQEKATELVKAAGSHAPKTGFVAASGHSERMFHFARATRRHVHHLKENWQMCLLWTAIIALNPHRTMFLLTTAVGIGCSLTAWIDQCERLDEMKKEFCAEVRKRVNQDKWMLAILASIIVAARGLYSNSTLVGPTGWLLAAPGAMLPAAATVDYLTREME